MIDAGSRNRRIEIEQATVGRDALGVEAESWVPLKKAWAAVRYGAGVERRAAAMEASSQSATFIVLANSMTRAVTTKNHRVVFDGRNWDIVSTMQSSDRAHMEFTATARNG